MLKDEGKAFDYSHSNLYFKTKKYLDCKNHAV